MASTAAWVVAAPAALAVPASDRPAAVRRCQPRLFRSATCEWVAGRAAAVMGASAGGWAGAALLAAGAPARGADRGAPRSFPGAATTKTAETTTSTSSSTTTTTTALLQTFSAKDFLIRRPVASQGYVALTEWTYRDAESGAEVFDPMAPTRTATPSEPAVRLYDATIVAPGPARNTRVMLKEFLPGGRELGVAEAEAYEKLASMSPEDAGSPTVGAAVGSGGVRRTPLGGPPVATLLGSFLSDDAFGSPDFRDSWRRSFPTGGEPPLPNTPWLVFRWEGNTTAASYLASTTPAAAAAAGVSGVGFIDTLFPDGAYQRRAAFLRAVLAGAAAAVAHLHGAGITHRSLGLSSLLLNTGEERLASSLDVKVRDFGFARPTAAATADPAALAAARGVAGSVAGVAAAVRAAAEAEDIYALGVAAAELVFGALAGVGPATSQAALVRLLEDVHGGDVDRVRAYMAEGEEWAPAVRFLDERDGGGWALLGRMLACKSGGQGRGEGGGGGEATDGAGGLAAELAAHPFLQPS
ncbi:hypothetical protein MMPV_006379 [Pyropia vietnamensis]